jgi:hypothetical protein
MRFGAFGDTLETARAAEFFAWFHLEPVDEDAGSAKRFRPSGAFGDRVALDVELDEQQRLVRMALRLRRDFIDDARDGAFAADAAQSFVRAVGGDAGRDLADALERRMRERPGVISAVRPVAERAPATRILPLLEAYDGGRPDAELNAGDLRIAFRNVRDRDAALVVDVTAA